MKIITHSFSFFNYNQQLSKKYFSILFINPSRLPPFYKKNSVSEILPFFGDAASMKTSNYFASSNVCNAK